MSTKKTRKECSDLELARLMDEANFLCPLCGHKLVEEKNGKINKLYQIAHIYPHSPTAKQIEALKNIPKPANIECLENLIPLCLACHRRQDFNTTEGDYWRLYHKKQSMIRNYLGKQATADFDIESEIQNVVCALKNMTPDEIEELVYSPVSIDNKVHDAILNITIRDSVSQFYGFIKNIFRDLDEQRTGTFENIAESIKKCFIKQDNAQWFQSENELFEYMVSWLQSKTNGPHHICAIIICFFVQNCEVFRDSSK